MQYPEDLLPIAERIVAVAHEVPRGANQWLHISDHFESEEIVPGLYLARVLVQFHDNQRLVRAAIKALAHERGVEFDDEVKSLRELTWALDDALGFLKLVDLQAMVGFLEGYLGRLEHELDGCDEIKEDEEDEEEGKSDKDTIGDRFRLGRKRGIEVPVLLVFDPGPQAEAVYTQLSGRSLEHTGNASGEGPEALTHTVAEAAGALRTHAGLGGRLVANLLAAPPAGVTGWLLSLSGNGIEALAYVSEQTGYRAHTQYDQLPAVGICPCCAKKEGPFPLVVAVEGSGNGDAEVDLFLQVADASLAELAMILARVAADRRIPSVGHDPDLLEFPVGDELATILSDFYGDSPELIAEVLRALGRERHPGRKWLLRTLRTAPGLNRLGLKVERLLGAAAGG